LSALSSTRIVGATFSQRASNQTLEEINHTAAVLNRTAPELMNQTAKELNQTASQMGNQISIEQTQSNAPKLTISDIQDIRDNLEELRKSITEGKGMKALRIVNEIDDKLLIAISENPPPMLEKSNDNNDDN
jgi:hypothetical protein